jgi:hypothetical protein
MDLEQQIRGFLVTLGNALDNMHIVFLLQRSITEPPISNNNAIVRGIIFYKWNQAFTRSSRDYPELYCTKVRVLNFNGNNHKSFCDSFISLYIFFSAIHKRSIYLNNALKPVSACTNHRTAKFMQPSPCSLISSKSHCISQILCTGSSLLKHHPPHYVQPKTQWFTRPLKQGSGDNRGLISTFGTDQKRTCGFPGSISMTTGVCATFRPTQPKYIIITILSCRKSCYELFKILRLVRLLHNMPTLLTIRWA